MLPKIGITCINQKNPRNGSHFTAVGETYVQAVSRTGGLPFLLPVITDEALLDEYVDTMDGFLFSGGIDVSPRFYGENPHPLLGDTSVFLDQCQIPLMQKIIRSRKPFLAICRGNQVLNVACGGTLYQDNSLHGAGVFKHMQEAERSDATHLVHITPGSALYELYGNSVWTNSFHHQSVKALGNGLRICGTAEDGIVEAIELENYPFGLGVQWHPEGMFPAEDSMRPLFEALIKKAAGK